ncbi:hypothetical protein D9M69_682790 [compost metagenome]
MRHRRRLEGADHADAGIVDERIDRTTGLERCRNAFGLGHIQPHDAHAVRTQQDILTWGAHGRDHVPAVGVEEAGGFEAVAG